MRALLVSTFELGRQPFGLASPAAWLTREGWEVTCVDLSRDRLSRETLSRAALVGFHLPMHTATRMAAPVISTARALNPTARLCAYGLYAPLNEEWLKSIGIDDILGGEFEEALAAIARSMTPTAAAPARRGDGEAGRIPRLHFLVPDRRGLPAL